MYQEIIVNNLAFSNSDQNQFTSLPFWHSKIMSKRQIVKNNFNKCFKISFKILKFLVYAFLLLMGLWGCFQIMIEPETSTSTILGQKLEFGFLPGTTGDYRYDLFSNSFLVDYYTFSNFGMEYGPFYALFVWPGAFITIHIMYPLRDAWGGMNALLALILLVLLIRTITLFISIRSTIHGEKMQEIQGRLAEINAKYKDSKDIESRKKKQIETMTLYKKYNVKPFASFEQIFVTLPIFLVIYRVVTILRPLKVTNLFNIWNLSQTPMNQIFNNFTDGGWTYLFLLAIIIPVWLLSQKLPRILSKKRTRGHQTTSNKANDQMKKMRVMQIVMNVFMIFIIVSSSSGIGLYWFLSSLFTIGQTFLLHYIILKNRKKGSKSKMDKFLKELGVY